MSLSNHSDNSSAPMSVAVRCETFDENQFIKNCVSSESVVNKISLYGSGCVTQNQVKVVPAPATHGTDPPKTKSTKPLYEPFHDSFKAKDTAFYYVDELLQKLNYVPADNNNVGELYQLPGINHHLLDPTSQVYKDILQSVLEYDPASDSNLNNWTFHVIESSTRYHSINPEIGGVTKSGWMVLKGVCSLQLLPAVDQANLYAQGKLLAINNSSNVDVKWNLMEGMHRAFALCQVSTGAPSHPIHALPVNVVVYQLVNDTGIQKSGVLETIMNMITSQSACIRDVNHNLTGSSHEGVLLMLIHSSFPIDKPAFIVKEMKKKKKKKTKARANQSKDPQTQQPTSANDSILKFIGRVKEKVHIHLHAITNLCLPVKTTDDLTCSPFITNRFISISFSMKTVILKPMQAILIGTGQLHTFQRCDPTTKMHWSIAWDFVNCSPVPPIHQIPVLSKSILYAMDQHDKSLDQSLNQQCTEDITLIRQIIVEAATVHRNIPDH